MQLYEELPILMAMFVSGFLGYMFVELVKWRAAARAKHMQKLAGLCEPDLPCTNAGTTVTMNPSDPAAYEETMKQPIHQQPNPRKRRQRNKKVARQACKAIHPVATRDEPPVSGDVNVARPAITEESSNRTSKQYSDLSNQLNGQVKLQIENMILRLQMLEKIYVLMDSSEGTAAAVNSDVQRLAENTPTVGTVVADKPLPSEMLAETAAGALAHGIAPTAAAGGECMTVDMDDAEADDEAEAEAQFVTSIQESSADYHEQPQVERVCQQPVLKPERERRIQGDDMEKPEEVMANDESALGQQVEGQEEEEKSEEHEAEAVMKPEQNIEGAENDKPLGDTNLEMDEKERRGYGQQNVEVLQSAPADEEQLNFHETELSEWPESTDEDSMSDNSSQWQNDDDNFLREKEWRRVLTSDWAEAQDEDWSESGYDMMHHRCLHALDGSASQHEALEHDTWSMPLANNQMPAPQSIDICSGKRKQGTRLDTDNWMTPFAPSDGEMPGWFTNDKWFGQGQRGSCGQHLEENDCWMTPFDELIQQTTTHVITSSDASVEPSVNSPSGAAVCIWNAGSCPASEASGDSSEGNGAAEIFTDGQQVFQPVPSATGQQLFTDGKQLYASVCVVVGPPSKAVDPCSPCSTVSFMAEESDED